MKNIKLKKFLETLLYNYLLLPTLIGVIGIGLAFGTLAFDRMIQFEPSWLYASGPKAARSLLSTIASSIASIAATTFSVIVVLLNLTSSQFGPRLVINFMRDTSNKVVLGTFIATFLHCLLVLRAVQEKPSVFVPHISITVGILLAITSVVMLIYFVQHAAKSIQSWEIIQNTSSDLDSSINTLLSRKFGQGRAASRGVEEIPSDKEASPILATGGGYIQGVDDEALVKIASSFDILVRLKHRPGNYIVEGDELARISPGKLANNQLTRQINDALILGKQRSAIQDVEFSVNRLVEIAIRAISPSINDPFTALQCINKLTAGLCRLAESEIPSPYRYDNDNKLRLIRNQATFAELTDSAFDPIRQYGRSDAMVAIGLLEAIATVAQRTRHQRQRAVLLDHAQAIKRDSREVAFDQRDRKKIDEGYQTAVKALEQ